jgi:hypothetical protein
MVETKKEKNMPKSTLWQAFLIVVGCIALWYTVMAGYRYYNYARLTAQTSPLSVDWNVVEISEESFIPQATYTFKVEKEVFSGETTWTGQTYLNRWGAEQSLSEFSSQERKVWYDASDPHHSSLQKKFPFKESISAGVLWALWLYFLWLSYYVSRFKR